MTITVEPNPATEGQRVTVRTDGPGPHYWRVTGLEWTEIPIDPETGVGTVDVPPSSGGRNLVVSDLGVPNPDNIEVPINSD